MILRRSPIFNSISSFLLVVFLFSNISSFSPVYAQAVLNLPAPGTLVKTSEMYSPALLRGVKVDVNNPLIFDFILDKGDSGLEAQALVDEGQKLIKYFLTALTVPEKELWVNLSPYEGNRILPEQFGYTTMGRDLLAQDYILKQLTASLSDPNSVLGQEFWKRIYDRAQQEFGTTDIPMNAFNKVWVMPDKAVIYEKGSNAYIVQNRLKVMMEQDYLSLANNKANAGLGTDRIEDSQVDASSKVSALIVREIIIPELTREINEGKNFANLRQVYNSLLLSAWYRRKVRESILGSTFLDKNKIAGDELADKTQKEQIYKKYVEAFRKGAYNYIKEDIDANREEVIPRKYFSGGAVTYGIGEDFSRQVSIVNERNIISSPSVGKIISDKRLVSMHAAVHPGGGRDKAMADQAAVNQQKKDRLIDVIKDMSKREVGSESPYGNNILETVNKVAPRAKVLIVDDQKNAGKFDVYHKDGVIHIAQSFLDEVKSLNNPYDMLQLSIQMAVSKGTEAERLRTTYNELAHKIIESRGTVKVFQGRDEEGRTVKRNVDEMIDLAKRKILLNEKTVPENIKNSFSFEPPSESVQSTHRELSDELDIAFYKMAMSRLWGRVNAQEARAVRVIPEQPVVKVDRRLRVGVIPFAADPPTLAHIIATIVMASAEARLDTVIVDTTGNDYRKEGMAETSNERLAFSRAIEGILGDIVTVLPSYLPANERKNGEERIPNYMVLNRNLSVDWFYVFGDDHGLFSKIMTGAWNSRNENTQYYIDMPSFREVVQKMIELDTQNDKKLIFPGFFESKQFKGIEDVLELLLNKGWLERLPEDKYELRSPDIYNFKSSLREVINLAEVNKLNGTAKEEDYRIAQKKAIEKFQQAWHVIERSKYRERLQYFLDTGETQQIIKGDAEQVYFPELDVEGKLPLIEKEKMPKGHTLTGLMAVRGDFEKKGFFAAPDRVFIERSPVFLETPLGTRGVQATDIRKILPEILRGQVSQTAYMNIPTVILEAVVWGREGNNTYIGDKYIPIALAKAIDSNRTKSPESELAMPKTVAGLLKERRAGAKSEAESDYFKIFGQFVNAKGYQISASSDAHTSTLTVSKNGADIGKVVYSVRIDLLREMHDNNKTVKAQQTLTADWEGNIASDIKDMIIDYIERVNNTKIVDKAMATKLTENLRGGIDFDLDNVDLDIQSTGPEIKFNFDPALLNNGNFDGLIPVILNVTPISDLPMFLGAKEEEKELVGKAG